MSFLDPRQWLLAIAFIGAVVLGVKFWEHRLVQQGDQAGYARAVSQAQKAADKARADAETKTRQLQTDADQARKEKADALDQLDRTSRALAERMRQRPERPAGGARLPAPASAGPVASGCTGAELYRSDGEFLVRESARADAIRIELQACYAAYERARGVVNATVTP